MKQTLSILLKKQADYLYRSLKLTVIVIFLTVSVTFFLFWEFTSHQNQLILWYIINLFILSLRIVLYSFYQQAEKDRPLKWINFFIVIACINAVLVSLIIFLVPEKQSIHYTYVLILIATLTITSIAPLGIIKSAWFIYLASLSLPLIIFFLSHTAELQSFHVYGYGIIFLFSGIAVIRVNKSLMSAFTMEIENSILKKKVSKETHERIHAESELQIKARELQLLNINLKRKVKEKTSELENLAFYDILTQLPNRHHFYDYINRTLSRNKKTQSPFALFFIDLDEFKTINDTLGHNFGDMLLVEVASRLRESTRVDDFIARIGGDEFIVIIKGVLSKTELEKIAENILKSINRPFSLQNAQTYISCSIGIALYPQDATKTQTLLKYSDLAMYYAKDHGKDSFYFYNNELYKQKAKKYILATELKMAIEKQELHLMYQPKVSAKDESVSSMEALLRWDSHKFGPVPVYKFINLAEESNQILELGDFVLRSALTQVKIWNEQHAKNFRISVNISAIQFSQKDFVEQVETILAQIDAKPEYLELEVTESAIMTNTQESIDKLTYLKSLGLKISIDDFGTGYSSMSYLKQLPIDSLKIDKSFIDGIPYDQDNQAITRAIIDLAHQFNLEAIAEGVEYKRQLDFLKKVGCQFIQGYYYYKPLSAEDFARQFIH